MLKDMLEAFVEREASFRLRLEIIKNINDIFDSVVYGDGMWAKVVGNGYMGKVNYFNDDIVMAYNRYAVHVNISKFQLKEAINQRPFDISACGGFVLMDERSDLREMFDEDEIVSYKSSKDLINKIKYYLKSDSERVEIAGRTKRKVLAEHTYLHRIENIIGNVMGCASKSILNAKPS
jgi:spore maturation protein CgeB